MDKLLNPKINQSDQSDDAYIIWKQKCAKISTINYYATFFTLLWHPLVMAIAYDFWANFHWALILNTF